MSDLRAGRVDTPRAAAAVVVGAVLCGGASRRFRSDKALARIAGVTLLERTLDVLRACSVRTLVATGVEPRYLDILDQRADCQIVLDREPDLGPLGGLEAALQAALQAALSTTSGAAVLVVACDLPNLNATVLAALDERRRTSGADVVLWRDSGGVHPLIGCYHTDALPAVSAALRRGERRLISFHNEPTEISPSSSAAKRVTVSYLGAADLDHLEAGLVEGGARDPAANANAPADLESIQNHATCTEEGTHRSADRRTT